MTSAEPFMLNDVAVAITKVLFDGINGIIAQYQHNLASINRISQARDMLHQRQACRSMQHFGRSRFHACALPRRQYNDTQRHSKLHKQ